MRPMLPRIVAVLTCAAGGMFAGGPSGAEMLEKIRAHAVETLEHLPNYLCRQTIERSVRKPGARRFTKLDTLRLDVALIGGKELYSWPGSPKFEEQSIEELVGRTGALGTGTFALTVAHVFALNASAFTFHGEEDGRGRKALRFDFRVSQVNSRYIISDSEAEATIAYHGSFLADAETLELIRLETYVDEVPSPISIKKATHIIEYARVKIGQSELLLPQRSERVLLSAVGESRNETRFDTCRQFVGESVISFGEKSAADVRQPLQVVEIPAGLLVEMRLATAISEKTSRGDSVRAILTKPLRAKNGAKLLPKEANLIGYVTRIERRKWGRLQYSVVGLTFHTAETATATVSFSGILEQVGDDANVYEQYHVPFIVDAGTQSTIWSNLHDETETPKPNEGVFYVRGDILRVTPGLRLEWRTAPQK